MAFTINLANFKTLFSKTKVRSQMFLVATEDGRLVPTEIPVNIKKLAVDDTKVSAFLIDAENQIREEATGIQYQLAWERSCVPICPIKERAEFSRSKSKDGDELWGLIKGIFHNSWVTDLVVINREKVNEKRMNILYILAGSAIPLAALVIAIGVIRA